MGRVSRFEKRVVLAVWLSYNLAVLVLRVQEVEAVSGRFIHAVILVTLLPSFSFARPISAAVDPQDFFENRIRPVLVNRCFACHTDLKSGGLRLDSRERLLKGGNSGPAIVPGNPDQSLLIQVVSWTHARLRMPMGGEKLKEQEIADLRAWVKMGAPWAENGNLPPAGPKTKEFVVTPEQRSFWSFQPSHKPSLPEVRNKAWPKSPIDHFILARLEDKGLKPAPPADKRTLIRRAYFDLIGLPPTPEEAEAFLKDTSPDAFARIVDGLLASPHYGERWGRYWLDVARYGEDDVRGLSVESYPNAFRYRDWVIQAFNDDLPYNLFVKAQIAGDLLTGESGKQKDSFLAATGFFGLGPWYYDIVEPPLARADERQDRVDALTRGFLGLTAACARCHNHKYDPISQADYYALAGVFASSEYREYPLVPGKAVADYEKHQKGIRDQEAALDEFTHKESDLLGEVLAAKTSRYMIAAWEVMKQPGSAAQTVAEKDNLDPETLERWIEYLRNPEKDHPYLKAWFDLLARRGSNEQVRKVADDFQDVVLSIIAEKKAIDDKNHVILEADKLAHSKANMKVTHLPNGFASYEEFCPGCYVEIQPIQREKYILWADLLREKEKFDDPNQKEGVIRYAGKEIERFLSGEWKEHLDSMRARLETLKKSAPPPYPFLHGLRESPEPHNIKINLRGSPYNLGDEAPRRFIAVLSEGEPVPFKMGSGRIELAEAIARHPLTARVMANRIWQHHFGWGLVRTPSNFGRLGERPTHPELLEYLTSRFIDSNYSVKALHREIMLSATYQLSAQYSEINFAQDPDNRLLWRFNRRRLDAEALRDSLLFASGNLDLMVGGPSVELTDECRRRTVYGKVSRFRLNPVLQLFDFPSPSITSEQRNATNVPIQRLFFMNSDLVWRQADLLARRLNAGGSTDDSEKIKRAYRLLFDRQPSEKELHLGLEYLRNARVGTGKNIASSAARFGPAALKAGASDSPTEISSAWRQYAQVLLSSNEFIFVN